jgi:glycosyltransferase involved in cell wall biosynthesis
VRRRCKLGSRRASALAALEKWAHQAWRLWERVDLFLCPSAYLRQTLLRFGLPAERLLHLPNLFDGEGWEPTEELGQHLLCAARLVEPKGVDLAIEAARRVGLPLRIAGDGPERPRLEAQARGLDVTFLGQLSRAALREELRQARVVLVPSRWPENLPYAIIEAQALGRAVVASDLGGARELIEHGRSGLLVPAGEPLALAQAIGELMSSPGRCRALGRAAARDTRKSTSPSLHITRLEALYQQLSRAP